MRGGFERLVAAATPVSQVDLEGTRVARGELRRRLRLVAHLIEVDEPAPSAGSAA